MPIPATQCIHYEFIVQGTISSGGGGVKDFVNVFCYRRLAVVVDVNKANVCTAFEAAVLADIALAMNDRGTINTIDIRCVNDADEAAYSKSVAIAGAVVGDGLANFNCVTVQLKSAVRGRSAMGSKHFGPCSESDGADDVLSATGLTRWQAARDACLVSFVDADGNDWVPCILSRTYSQLAVNPTTVYANDVVQAILNTTYGTMKRRKVRTVV